MKNIISGRSLCGTVLLATFFSGIATAQSLHTETIAPGIYAVINDDPLGLANHANSVFIVGDDDVIVVDTQFTLERTRLVLASIRRVTDKPVSTVVNTHWHDDHTFGNQVYRETFPGVEFIAHVNTDADMQTAGVANRKGQIEGGPDAITAFGEAIENNVNLDGTPLSESGKIALQSTIVIATEYLHDIDEFSLTRPTRTFDSQLTLTQGDRKIEIRNAGPAVTRGDAIVYLPQDGVLIAGDLVSNPLPFAYGADIDGWIASLGSILDLNPRVIVPGHGDVMNDDHQVRALRRLLVAISEQARAVVGRGGTVEELLADVDVDDFRTAIAGSDKMMEFLFDSFFLHPALRSAFDAEAKSHP